MTVYADSAPGGNVADPAVRAADVAGPAVVRIITTIKGHLTVHFPPTTQVTFPQLDNGSYSLQISGTGTFITSHGDILASDHVVNPPKDRTLDEMLYNAAAQDIANYINQNAKQGSSQVTRDDVIQQLSNGQPSSTTSYDAATSVVYLSTSYTGPLAVPDLKSLPTGVTWQVDQIKKESPDQQDLAIVHVPMQDAPSVQLADSSKIQGQGDFTVISFPSNVDVSRQPNDFLTASVAGSKQTTATATPLSQVGGNADNGNGGGLALDSQGNIVGIISSPDSSGGTSFLQKNNNQRAMLSSVNLDTTPGQFQQLWSQAFQDYASTAPSHWQKAQGEFNQLQANYPNFKAAQSYLNYGQEQVQSELATPTSTAQPAAPTVQAHQSGRTRSRGTPAPFPSAQVLTVTAIVLLLGLVVLLFTVIAGRAKKGNLAKMAERRADAANVAVPIGEGRSDGDLPQPSLSGGSSAQSTLVLKIWPCGHMNRPGARFCSMCGEAAPDGS
ncbi:MAG TPA: zinc ribbon domain-containing protein [Ktedonobacteraceae bacterium]|nr:zinc ribbon domain-containing protein [Ktedonobacteraceae bacterium]